VQPGREDDQRVSASSSERGPRTASPVARRPSAWWRVADAAATQGGVVSRRQLRDCGLSDRQIAGAIRHGRIHRVHRGVFSVGHASLTHEGRCVAGVLAAGPRSALGYRTAGAHWSLRPWSSRSVEVVVAGTSRPAHRGLVVHRHPDLGEDEVLRDAGVRVTTVARTLLDLAAVVPPTALRGAVGQAEILRLFDLTAVRALLDRHPRHRGAPALRHVLASWAGEPRTRSPQEAAFPDLCASFGFPRPVMNAVVLGMEIDATFPDQGVAVELDSRAFHRGVISREDDHEKRARLAAAGWTPLAYTYRQVHEDGGRFVRDTLGPALARRRDGRP
jgi:hypothetical protein